MSDTDADIRRKLDTAIAWMGSVGIGLSDLKALGVASGGRIDIQIEADCPGGKALDAMLQEQFNPAPKGVARYVLGSGAVSFHAQPSDGKRTIPGTQIHGVIIHDSPHAHHEAREKRLKRLREDAERLGMSVMESNPETPVDKFLADGEQL